MYAQLKDDNIPIKNLITLISDGPNVNKTIMFNLQSLIKEDYIDFSEFIDLGSCVLHVHNAFGIGLQKCAKDVEQLCMDLHRFKYSAACR